MSSQIGLIQYGGKINPLIDLRGFFAMHRVNVKAAQVLAAAAERKLCKV